MISKWSKRFGVDAAILEKKLQELIREEKESGRKEDKAELRAKARLYNALLRKQMRRNSWQGVIVGKSDIFDVVEIRKRVAAAIFSRDPDRAIKENYTDESGTPLDNNEFIRGQRNPRYLKPLSGSYKLRRVALLTEGKLKSVSLLRDQLDNFVPMWREVTFSGGESNRGMVYANSPFTETGTEAKIEQLLKESSDYVPLREIFTSEKQNIITEADVVAIRLTGGRKSLNLADIECPEPVFAFLPDWYEPNFGEDSRVFVIGNLREGRRGKLIQVQGVYPKPGYMTKKVEAASEADEWINSL